MVRRLPKPVQTFSLVHENMSNVNYELQYTRWLLTALGVWPRTFNKMSRNAKISSFILITLSILASTLFAVIPSVKVITMKTFRAKLTLVAPVTFRISNLFKLIALVYRVGVIKDCVNQIKNDWLKVMINDERNVMLKNVDFGRRLTSLCATFMFSTGLFFHVGMPLLKPKRFNALNVTIRPHPYPYDFIVNSQVTPTYEIIFAVHCACAGLGYFIIIGCCNLAAIFVCHVSGQVEIIGLKLERIDYGIDNVDDQIASIVRSHVNILRFSGNIETVLQEICMFEVVLSTLVICWTGFYCIMVEYT